MLEAKVILPSIHKDYNTEIYQVFVIIIIGTSSAKIGIFPKNKVNAMAADAVEKD